MIFLNFILNLIALVVFCIGLVVSVYLFYIGIFIMVMAFEYGLHSAYLWLKDKFGQKE